MKSVISVDWLEYFVYLQGEELYNGVEEAYFGSYTLKREDYGTKFFAYAYKVYYKNKEVAYMICHPRASFIKSEVATIKISNRILYCEKIWTLAASILNALPVRVKGITRIDLACDLLTFANGYRPHRFIKNFIAKDKDEDGFIHHYGCKNFTLFGSKNANSNSKFDYIRFGSRTSAVQVYLYNKSKELREVKDKPYIREIWEKNGLVIDKQDVWRVEISIKAQGLKTLNIETGEYKRIDSSYVDSQNHIEAMFFAYAKKYFRFGVKNGQKRAKDYNELTLLEFPDDIPWRPYNPCEKLNSGRTERIIINRILEVSEIYSDLSGYMRKSLIDTVNFFGQICANKSLIYNRTKNAQNLMCLTGRRLLCEDGLQMFREGSDWEFNSQHP